MEIKKSTMMWIIIGVLLVATIFLTFKAGDTSVVQTTGNAVQAAARSAPVQQASSGMVGGC